MDRSLSTVGHRHTKLQRPEVAASLSPHGAAQKLADEAPQGFPDRDGPQAPMLLGQGVKRGASEVHCHSRRCFAPSEKVAEGD